MHMLWITRQTRGMHNYVFGGHHTRVTHTTLSINELYRTIAVNSSGGAETFPHIFRLLNHSLNSVKLHAHGAVPGTFSQHTIISIYPYPQFLPQIKLLFESFSLLMTTPVWHTPCPFHWYVRRIPYSSLSSRKFTLHFPSYRTAAIMFSQRMSQTCGRSSWKEVN